MERAGADRVSKPAATQARIVAFDGQVTNRAFRRARSRARRKNRLPRSVKWSGWARNARSWIVSTSGASLGGTATMVPWTDVDRPGRWFDNRPTQLVPGLEQNPGGEPKVTYRHGNFPWVGRGAPVTGRYTDDVDIPPPSERVRQPDGRDRRAAGNRRPRLLDGERDPHQDPSAMSWADLFALEDQPVEHATQTDGDQPPETPDEDVPDGLRPRRETDPSHPSLQLDLGPTS